jgi:hypothetical protein
VRTQGVPLRMPRRAWRADRGGGDGGAHGYAIGGGLLGVSGLQKPEFLSIQAQKPLKNGSETAE